MRRSPLALATALLLVGCAATGTPSSGAPATSASATSSPAGAFAVELVGDRPVFDPAQLGAYPWVLPGAFVFDDGVYHAWVVGFGQERGDQRVFHITSSDARSWNVGAASFEADLGVEFSPPGPIPASVIRMADGTWAMYFWGTPAPETDRSSIWRATAADLEGPWSLDPEPSLGHGELDDWDGRGLDFPGVVRAAGGYVMVHSGASFATRAVASIGVATSPDGVDWTKAGEPVIAPGFCGGFDERNASQSRVVAVPDGSLLLAYGGDDGGDDGMQLGLAMSADGVAWTCRTPSAVLAGDDIPGSTGIHTTAMTQGAEEQTLLLIEALMDQGSQLWLASVEAGP